MEEIVKQIRSGIESNLYLLCLNATLTLPDICGAVESIDGSATGNKYKKWYDTYVFPGYKHLTGSECFDFRCRLLHQGQTTSKKTEKYSHVAFAEPRPSTQGRVSINIGQTIIDGQPGPKSIDVVEFIIAVLNAVENWLEMKKGTEPFESNNKKCIKRYPDGLLPIVTGVAYIY